MDLPTFQGKEMMMNDCELNCCFVKRVDCANKMPPEDHNFILEEEFGYFEGYGRGTMKYRKCLKCGLIEYSLFTGTDGTTEDIDQIYRNPGNYIRDNPGMCACEKWHGAKELNPQPPDLESSVLPIELAPCSIKATK
jgi:hypothetical protein